MTTVKFGLIGAGDIVTHAHIPALQAISSVEIFGVFDAAEGRATEVSKRFDIPRAFDEVDDLLSDNGIDAVLIATPNRFHAPYAVQALQSGKHVLCEKPAGITRTEAQQVVEAAEQNGKVVSTCFHFRQADEMRWVRNTIAEKKLGKIKYANVRSFRRKAIPGYGSWFTQKELSGGGTLFDNGSHLIDLVMWLTGFPQVKSIDCDIQTVHGNRQRGLGAWGVDHDPHGKFDVEDFAVARLVTMDDAVLNIETCWAIHADNEFRVQIVGELGGIDFFPRLYGVEAPMRVYMQGDADVSSDHSLQYSFPDGTIDDACSLAVAGSRKSASTKNMQTQVWNRSMKCFVDSLKDRASSSVMPDEIVAVIELLQLAYQSAETNTRVEL